MQGLTEMNNSSAGLVSKWCGDSGFLGHHLSPLHIPNLMMLDSLRCSYLGWPRGWWHLHEYKDIHNVIKFLIHISNTSCHIMFKPCTLHSCCSSLGIHNQQNVRFLFPHLKYKEWYKTKCDFAWKLVPHGHYIGQTELHTTGQIDQAVAPVLRAQTEVPFNSSPQLYFPWKWVVGFASLCQ